MKFRTCFLSLFLISTVCVNGPADNYGSVLHATTGKLLESILDTFSCFVQGLIPYGAQILMAAGLFGISLASIVFDYPRRLNEVSSCSNRHCLSH